MRVSNELLRRCLEECDRGAECSLWRMVGLADVLHDLEEARRLASASAVARDLAEAEREEWRSRHNAARERADDARHEAEVLRGERDDAREGWQDMTTSANTARACADHERRRADRYEDALRSILREQHGHGLFSEKVGAIVNAALRPDDAKVEAKKQERAWHGLYATVTPPASPNIAGEDAPPVARHIHCGMCGEAALYVGGVGGAFGGLKEKHYRCLACGSSGKHHGGDAWVSWMAGTEDSASSLYRTNVKEGEG